MTISQDPLKNLGWLPINEMLQLRDVTMVYKCLNGLAPNYLQSKLVKRCRIHRYNTRREMIFVSQLKGLQRLRSPFLIMPYHYGTL